MEAVQKEMTEAINKATADHELRMRQLQDRVDAMERTVNEVVAKNKEEEQRMRKVSECACGSLHASRHRSIRFRPTSVLLWLIPISCFHRSAGEEPHGDGPERQDRPIRRGHGSKVRHLLNCAVAAVSILESGCLPNV
jgi:uncharacterized coiled-coil protein SlyX